MIYKRYTTGKKTSTSIHIGTFIIALVLCFSTGHGRASSFWKPIYPQADALVELIGDEKNERSDSIVSRLYTMADSLDNDNLRARTIFLYVYINGPSDFTEMFSKTNQAIAMADSADYPYDYHRLLALKSNILLNMGNYIEAFKLLSLTTPYFTAVEDSAQTAVANGNIGLIYLLIEEYDEAFRYLQRAQQLFKQNGNLHSYLLSCQQIAYIYEKTGREKNAKEELRSIIDKYRDAPADVQVIRYYCIASYFKLLDNSSRQEIWLDELYDTALKTGNWQCRVNAVKNKAAWFFAQNQLDSALLYADSAYHYAQTNLLTFGQEGDIYKLLSQIHGSRSEWRDAYRFRVMAEEYQDSIRVLDMRTDIQKEKIRQEIAQNDMRLHELEIEKRQSVIIGTIVAIALLLLLIPLRKPDKNARSSLGLHPANAERKTDRPPSGQCHTGQNTRIFQKGRRVGKLQKALRRSTSLFFQKTQRPAPLAHRERTQTVCLLQNGHQQQTGCTHDVGTTQIGHYIPVSDAQKDGALKRCISQRLSANIVEGTQRRSECR